MWFTVSENGMEGQTISQHYSGINFQKSEFNLRLGPTLLFIEVNTIDSWDFIFLSDLLQNMLSALPPISLSLWFLDYLSALSLIPKVVIIQISTDI